MGCNSHVSFSNGIKSVGMLRLTSRFFPFPYSLLPVFFLADEAFLFGVATAIFCYRCIVLLLLQSYEECLEYASVYFLVNIFSTFKSLSKSHLRNPNDLAHNIDDCQVPQKDYLQTVLTVSPGVPRRSPPFAAATWLTRVCLFSTARPYQPWHNGLMP